MRELADVGGDGLRLRGQQRLYLLPQRGYLGFTAPAYPRRQRPAPERHDHQRNRHCHEVRHFARRREARIPAPPRARASGLERKNRVMHTLTRIPCRTKAFAEGEKMEPLRERPLLVSWGAYQFSFKPNWNCRGSSEAVGWPAVQVLPGPPVISHSGFTSATLKRLNRLNMSVMNSRLTLSVKWNLREMRRSHWKKLGRTNVFRPRLPVQPTGGETGGTGLSQTVGRMNETPGMNGEVAPPEGATDGRAVFAPKSNRRSLPVRTVKGRPEDTSTIGATVKSARNLCQKPSAVCL